MAVTAHIRYVIDPNNIAYALFSFPSLSARSCDRCSNPNEPTDLIRSTVSSTKHDWLTVGCGFRSLAPRFSTLCELII
jgi:hypothetical protein